MSITKALLNRKQLPATVKVKVGDFEFEVARFASAERECANVRAKRLIAELFGTDAEAATNEERITALSLAYKEYIKRHVRSWVHTPDDASEPAPFTKQNLDTLFENLSVTDIVLVATGYLNAEGEDKKKEDLELSTQVSVNS